MKFILGIDEVGRGPMAGPVTVCVVVCEEKIYEKLKRDRRLPLVGKDSKKLSQKDREKYAKYLKQCARLNLAHFQIVHISNKIIDKKGISFAIRKAMTQGLKKLTTAESEQWSYDKIDPKNCNVRLDGSLKAPPEFTNQKTIIKGDEKEKIIAWASILAKVSRDSLMCKMAKKFPEYGFELHKGYGTVKHKKMIKKYGISVIHRLTFCKNT